HCVRARPVFASDRCRGAGRVGRGLAAHPSAGRWLVDQCGAAGRGVDGYAVEASPEAGVIRTRRCRACAGGQWE
ncbi:hypothetical protein, partial [Acinetobacter nosocomialis]|uniref:hypothetical protein n=1 Tax=Acinetobacter nosocomialis TaxID=106654 RepID=UPI0013D1B4BF